MTSLQHLDINGCKKLTYLPPGIKEVTSLCMLSRFPVGKEIGVNIGELGELNLLEGELDIKSLENVGDKSEAKSANLKNKQNMTVLRLSWKFLDNWFKEETNSEIVANEEEVLEGLEPNPDLHSLEIKYYMGNKLSPSWMANLRNLVKITFSHCHKCEHIPALGRIPNLTVITLKYMDSLKRFHDEDTNMIGDIANEFLSLQELHIHHCRLLVVLPCNHPKLKVLDLYKCEKLVSLPDKIQSFKDMNQLRIIDCTHLSPRYEEEIGEDWPKISHNPRIKMYSYWHIVKRRLQQHGSPEEIVLTDAPPLSP